MRVVPEEAFIGDQRGESKNRIHQFLKLGL